MKQVFEVKVPRENEETPEQASTMFASLSSYKTPILQKLFGKEKCLTFEIGLFGQTIHFYIVAEEDFASYFISQLTAQYPQAVIGKTKDYLASWQMSKASFGQLVLSDSYFFPLRTYQEFKEVDPLSSLLGTLAKAGSDDKALFQVSIAPAPRGFEKAARKFLDKGVSTADGQATRTHPQSSLINQKISQKGFKTALRLLTISLDKTASNAFLSHLSGSFGAFSKGDGNSLSCREPKAWQKRGFLKAILSREFKFVPRHQFLNIDELATLYHFPNKDLAGIKNIAWGGTLSGEPPENLPVAQGLDKEEKSKINFLAKTEFKNRVVNFGIKKEDRGKHIYIIGKTGTGKTTLIANMAINDMRNREGLGVIDPHGDLSEILLDYVPSYRLNDVCYLDPADRDYPFHLNPLEVTRREQAELVASGIVSIFYKLYYYSWGPRLEYILRNTLLTLVERPGSTLVEVVRILSDENFRQKVVDQLEDPVLKGFWLNEFNKMPDRLRQESISPILNKVGQFTSSPLMRNIIGFSHSTIDFEEFMNQGKILIVNLSQGRLGEDNAALLGAMFITKMQLAAMSRVSTSQSKRRDFYLYVDEFQNFATSSFIKILSEARKYRLNLCVANQYIGQLPEDVMKAIFGNVGTLLSFLIGAQDARFLSPEYGNTFSEEDLVKIGTYQIILKLSINNLTSIPFSGYTLPLPSCRNKNREKVLRLSRERYTKPLKK